MPTIEEIAKKILADIAEVEVQEINKESTLEDDLKLSKLGIDHFAERLKNKFDISELGVIPHEEWKTFGDVIDYLQNKNEIL